jgi:serine/threonine protein kinase
MTADQWAAVRQTFDEAVRIEAANLEHWLNERCGADADVLNEVKVLLAADGYEQGVLTRLGERLSPHSSRNFTGLRIGSYELLDAVGKGGMGSVYRAKRNDEAFDKTVAVKLIGFQLAGSEIESAFRRERRILAGLDHPNIARLLDAGTTQAGLLYLVMEFVEGEPIDVYCRRKNLEVPAKLALFADVCSAVQFAHKNFVVHRDLKPRNILVTAEGKVKLLDFGIAKILSDSLGSEETVSFQMTPQYASPEQIKGERITTASDIYSLGVLLYELLTGCHPQRTKNNTPHDWAIAVCEQEPRRPSAVALQSWHAGEIDVEDPRQLQRQLKGDLDSILLMALRKEPEGRYTSVEQFAGDLVRHIEKRPVIAREPTLGYQLVKFTQRRPGALAAAILIILTILTGTATTLWQARIALQQWREAQTLLQEAQQLRAQAGLPANPRRDKQSSPKRIDFILKPQSILFVYLAATLLAIALYMLHASLRRVVGALIGGTVCATAWFCKFRFDEAMGWTRQVSPDAPKLLELFPLTFLLVPSVCFGAALLLLIWQLGQRFGLKVQVPLTILLSIHLAFRERFWTEHLLEITHSTSGFIPFAVDTLIWLVTLVLAHRTMQMIAFSRFGR